MSLAQWISFPTTTGWVILRHADGSTSLYRTMDGGATWTLISGNSTIPPSSTPTADPAAFAQMVVDTLNARNFDAVKVSMDQSFAFAQWQGQSTSYTADEAIASLRTYNLTIPLTSEPGKDLNALLSPANPYGIMGLDPANSWALFVSGWGLDGRDEAILYVTRRADGSLYWHSVLVAPGGFARFATSTPAALQGPYAVVGIAPNNVLAIRSGPGSFPEVGSFARDATNVMRTGPTAIADGAEWVEIQRPDGGLGWVNSFYLTEYVTHDAFCAADSQILSLIEQLKGIMNQSNGEMFSALVSPMHGVDVRLWAYQPAVNFTSLNAKTVFASTVSYDWGAGLISGTPDIGTFKDIIQPKLVDTLNASNTEKYCDNLTGITPLPDPWPYHNIRFYRLFKPSTSPELLNSRRG